MIPFNDVYIGFVRFYQQ